MNFKNYINEAKNWKSGKEMGENLSIDVTNGVGKIIDKWINKNVGINGWPNAKARDEAMLILANNMLDYFNGMKKASEKSLKRK